MGAINFKTVARTGVPGVVSYYAAPMGNVGSLYVAGSSVGINLLTGANIKESLMSGLATGVGHWAGGQVGGFFGSKSPWWNVGGTVAGAYIADRAVQKAHQLRKQRRAEEREEKRNELQRRNLGIPHAPEDPMANWAEKYIKHREDLSRQGISITTEPEARPSYPVIHSGGLENFNVEAETNNTRAQYHDPAAGAIDPPKDRQNTERTTNKKDLKYYGSPDRHVGSSDLNQRARLERYIHQPQTRVNQFTGRAIRA
jgi:hypothetical protein